MRDLTQILRRWKRERRKALELKTEAADLKNNNLIIQKHKMDKKQIKRISVNINGLNSLQKLKWTFLQLKKLNLDVICLQEIHMRRSDQKLLE